MNEDQKDAAKSSWSKFLYDFKLIIFISMIYQISTNTLKIKQNVSRELS